MFYLGIIGFLQMTALPGLIVLKTSRYKGGLIQTIALCFAISLFCNYVIAWSLSLVGLYSTWVVRALVIVEIGTIVWLYRSFLTMGIGEGIRSAWKKVSDEVRSHIIDLKDEPDNKAAFKIVLYVVFLIALVLAVNSIIWALVIYRINFGQVFQTWDAILSWNSWAVEWTSGKMPLSGYYPLLIPANWSMVYLIQGNPAIQLFAKSVMPLFFLLIILLVFDLGWNAKSIGILLGVVILQFMEKNFLGDILADGYMEIPVAFLGFFSIYMLLKSPEDQEVSSNRQILWFSALAALASALTKQAGLFIFLIWPILVLVLFPAAKDARASKFLRSVLFPFGVCLLFLLTFYLYRFVQIQNGIDSSNITYLTQGIYGGAGLWERGISAVGQLEKYKYCFLFAILVVFIQKPRYRWLTLMVVIPFSLIWAFYFSYDIRNISLVLPFVALVCGAGMERLIEFGTRLMARLNFERIGVYIFALLGLLVVGGLGFIFTNQKISDRQTELQWQILYPSLDAKLHDYLDQDKLDGKVITNYPIRYLPGLADAEDSFWFNDLVVFQSEQASPANGYLLIPSNASNEIWQIVDEKLESGDYKLIFQDDGAFKYQFIQIIRRTP